MLLLLGIYSISLVSPMAREGVRGVAGVATATPILQILFHKIVVLKWPKIPKVQIPKKTLISQKPEYPKALMPKARNA